MTTTLVQVSVNQSLFVKTILESLIQLGVEEFCICPAGRNAPLVYPLAQNKKIKIYNWSEERSAAFFALGRAKLTRRPVAVLTTSGTAAAELLPAAMEAYYAGIPLILITADRPRRFRGTGAPQSAEQVGLFSHYVYHEKDLEAGDELDFQNFLFKGPIHLNICLEEPKDSECRQTVLDLDEQTFSFNTQRLSFNPSSDYLNFLVTAHYPLVIVGSLPEECREAVMNLLWHLQAPVYLEAQSGLREKEQLNALQIHFIDHALTSSQRNDYPIDAVLRIGSIPTTRLWRDLEDRPDILVCSIDERPFSGLSGKKIIHTCLHSFSRWALHQCSPYLYPFQQWKKSDQEKAKKLIKLFEDEPLAEPSLMYQLSKRIPCSSQIYLGNSLPIREWDLAATLSDRHYRIEANRGVNGIDGQLSTFLGMCSPHNENWAILGDLTLLYDMAAPWIYTQMQNLSVNVVVINNQGGQIFSRLFSHPIFLNQHTLSFKSLATFWGWHYEKWDIIPTRLAPNKGARFIELVPHPKATDRFWNAWKIIQSENE